MPLNGVHITCGLVNVPPRSSPGLFGAAAWSETFPASSPGTTSRAAPGFKDQDPDMRDESFLAFEIQTSVEIFVAIGKAPDATNASGTGDSARIRVVAGESRNLFCEAGDKVAWVAA